MPIKQVEQAIKQRLVGAIVLVSLVVIFLPFVFDGRGVEKLPAGLFDMPAAPPENDAPPPKPAFPGNTEDASKMRTRKYEDIRRKVKVLNTMDSPDMSAPPDTPQSENGKYTPPVKHPPPPGRGNDKTNPSPGPSASPIWRVQLATFGNEEYADNLQRRLKDRGYGVVKQSERDDDGTTWFVVILIKQGTYDEIEQLVGRLTGDYHDIKQPIIRKGEP